MAKRVILNGEDGDVWTNDTSITWWQLECSLVNTCGSCLQFHMAIAERWFLPLHRRCRCRVQVVSPGSQAMPWVDYRQMLRSMDPSQHRAAVGHACFDLIESGVVKWEDVVTQHRVRSLQEVVAREGLKVKTMTKAGVPRHIAERAYSSVNTPVHEIQAAVRSGLIDSLRGAGLTDQQIKQGFAERVVAAGRAAAPESPVTIPIKGAAVKPIQIPLGSPEKRITAGNVVLERIRRGTAAPAPSLPDFGGSFSTMESWVKHEFPEGHKLLTNEDWFALMAAVKAQADLKRIFEKLGIDQSKGLGATGTKP